MAEDEAQHLTRAERGAALGESHTPGPWIVGDVYKGEHEIDAPNGDPRFTETGWKRMAVCYSVAGSEAQHIKRVVGEANARLIAAAPDLLSAAKRALAELREYAGFYRHVSGGTGCNIDSVADELEEVIDKATQVPT